MHFKFITDSREIINIYIRNSNGLNIDPCGTPVAIEALFDFMPSYSTY